MAKFVSLIRSIKIDHLIFSLFCACVIIIPSYYDSTAAAVFSAPKLFALRIITLLLIFLFILKGFKEKKVTFIKTPFNYFLLTYAFICLLNVILTCPGQFCKKTRWL